MNKSKANDGRTKGKRGNIIRIRRVKPKKERRKTQSLHKQAFNNFLLSSNNSKQPRMSQKYLSKKEETRIKKENLAKTLSKSLVALDSYLQAYRTLKDRRDVDRFIYDHTNLENKELREIYEGLILRFLNFGEIDETVLYYAWCLNRKAVQKLKEADDTMYKMGENILLFSSCLYLSIKMLVDLERWFIEDFCLVSGMEEEAITQMEICLLTEILGFNYFVTFDEIKNEKMLINKKNKKFRIWKGFKKRRLRTNQRSFDKRELVYRNKA